MRKFGKSVIMRRDGVIRLNFRCRSFYLVVVHISRSIEAPEFALNEQSRGNFDTFAGLQLMTRLN
jgi:hypothetical protein